MSASDSRVVNRALTWLWEDCGRAAKAFSVDYTGQLLCFHLSVDSTCENISVSNPGMDLKWPSFSIALRSMALLSKAVAQRGVGLSVVEMTP